MTLSLALSLTNPRAATGSTSPVAGDPIAFEAVGPSITDSARTVSVNGWVGKLTFKGMNTRANGSKDVSGNFVQVNGLDATKVSISVTDPGFDTSGAATTVNRTITGTCTLGRLFPAKIVTGGGSVVIPADSYIGFDQTPSGPGRIYYCLTGGTWTGVTGPTHTSGTTTVGTVDFTYVDNQAYFAGFFQNQSGSDCERWFSLDGPIFSGTTINSVTVTSGAYNDGTISSNTKTLSGASVTKSTTLAYPLPIVGLITQPHLRSTGSLVHEVVASHGFARNNSAVACVKVTPYNLARNVSGTPTTVSTPSLSNIVNNPGTGIDTVKLEVYSATVDTSGISYGDGVLRTQVYPWLGDTPYDTFIHGDAADWRANTVYPDRALATFAGAVFYASTGGTSGSSTPSGAGADGSVTWAAYGSDFTVQNSRNPQVGLHFFSDPSDVYRVCWVNVDPSGTCVATTIGGGSKVYASRAAALAASGTLANCYADLKLAQDAVKDYNTNNTGDGKTAHSDAGGGTMLVKAGTYGAGIISASMQTGGGVNRPSVWVTMEALGTVVLPQTPTSKVGPKRSYWKGDFQHTAASGALSFMDWGAADGTNSMGQIVNEVFCEGWTYTGFDTSGNSMMTRIGQFWLLNSTINTAFLYGDSGVRGHMAYIAGCVGNITTIGNLQVNIPNVYGCKFEGSQITKEPRNNSQPAMQFSITKDCRYENIGSLVDTIIVGHNSEASRTLPTLGIAVDGILSEVRLNGGRTLSVAADASNGDVSNVVIANCTLPGARINHAYDDTAAGQGSAHPLRSNWYMLNNVLEDWNCVGGYHDHNGRPDGQKMDNMWAQYHVGYRNNVSFIGGPIGIGKGHAFQPLDGYWDYNPTGSNEPANQFVDNRCQTSGGTTSGGGDYHPYEGGGSHLMDQTTVNTRKYALDGQARRSNSTGAAGAYERA